MSKLLKKNWGKKFQKLIGENDHNEFLVNRVHHWRNLQILDKSFDNKKQKVLWPLYDEARDGPDAYIAEDRNKTRSSGKQEKVGFNSRLFNGLNSVKKVHQLSPVRTKKMQLDEREVSDGLNTE